MCQSPAPVPSPAQPPDAAAAGGHLVLHGEQRAAALAALRRGERVSVVALDLDRFGTLAARAGLFAARAVLDAAAARMVDFPGGCLPLHRGQDEFLVLLIAPLGGDARVAEALRLHVRRGLGGSTLSAGVSTLDGAGPGSRCPGPADVAGLYARAWSALRQAKLAGRDRTVRAPDDGGPLPPGFHGQPPDQALLALDRLVLRGPHAVAFQPIWDLDLGEPLGYEALARLGPGAGGPGGAFDLAESLSMAAALDRRCLRAAALAAVRLPPGGLLFVNVSAQSLASVRRGGGLPVLVGELVAAMARAGRPPGRVVVELTERGLARTRETERGVAALRDAGFLLALDDAGSGEAGLAALSWLRLDFLKIDRSLVRPASRLPFGAAVLDALLAYAAALGTYVIAEGVEDPSILDALRRRPGAGRIRGAQGYLLGRPAPGPQPAAAFAAARALLAAPAVR